MPNYKQTSVWTAERTSSPCGSNTSDYRTVLILSFCTPIYLLSYSDVNKDLTFKALKDKDQTLKAKEGPGQGPDTQGQGQGPDLQGQGPGQGQL